MEHDFINKNNDDSAKAVGYHVMISQWAYFRLKN